MKTNVLLVVLWALSYTAHAQFVHPGGIHSQADLDRIKAKVLAKSHPWIDGWNSMITNTKAQNTYVAKPSASISGADGVRQQAARDACAAYYNTLRWYVTGDVSYANCAVGILNAWSSSINAVVTGELFQLPIYPMVQAGELLRIYPGWAATDFARFKSMCLNYFYPACKSFTGYCGTWPGWDGPANTDMLAIAVLCDDTVKYNEAINYYKTGAGGGGFYNTFCQPSGQISEMGRDQPHAEIGPGFAAQFCQIAWNQGLDLFSFADNRLLAGFEYFCKFNLNHPVTWVPYNDCNNHNFLYLSQNGANTLSHSPDYELVYHHYTEIKGLQAPYTRAMINLRGIVSQTTNDNYLGYYGLTYALSDTTTLYAYKSIPAPPVGLTAKAGNSCVELSWSEPSVDAVNGYVLYRSTSLNGNYVTLTSWTGDASTQYVDATAVNGVTYYYKVAAKNQSGTSAASEVASATPVATSTTLPEGWSWKDVGTVAVTGSATFANVAERTFKLVGSGSDVGGTADSHDFAYTSVTGDFILTARLNQTLQDPNYAKIKIGLIVRESLSSNSRKFVLNLGDVQTRFMWFSSRTSVGGGTSWQQGDSHTWTPVWMRLKRMGNTFTGYQSSDGITWYSVGTLTSTLPSNLLAGLFVCGGSTSTDFTASATFDHITVTGGGKTTATAPSNVSISAVNSGRINLSWTEAPAAISYEIKRSTSPTGPFATIEPTWNKTTFSDSGLVANTTYYYVLRSSNFTGNSSDSAMVSVQTLQISVPAVPTGLSIVSGNLSAELRWSYTDQATGYTVKRALAPDGPYISLGNVTALTFSDKQVTSGTTYYYLLSAYNSSGNGPESNPIEHKVVAPVKLTGVAIGTAGSYNNNATTTKDAALDGSFSSFFDANVASAWVGLDMGENNRAVVAKVRYAPRSGYPARMVNGVFQAANNVDFSDAQTLFTVSSSPNVGSWTEKEAFHFGRFRYLRYLSPADGWGNVSEVEFWGSKTTLPVGIQSTEFDKEWTVFPNPVYEELHVRRNEPCASKSLTQLYDIQGKLLLHKEFATDETVLDVHALFSGIYLLKVTDGKSIRLYKIVK